MIDMNTETIVSDKLDLKNNMNNYDDGVEICKSDTRDNKSEISQLGSNESFIISSPSSPQNADNHVVVKETNLQNEWTILENDTSLTSQKLPICDYNESESQDFKLKSSIPCENVPEDGKHLLLPKDEVVQATSPCDMRNNEVELSTACKKINDSIHDENVPENLSNLKHNSEEMTKVFEGDEDLGKGQTHSNIYCSTPVVSSCFMVENEQIEKLNKTNDFGQVSPLNAVCKKNRKDLKRKFLGLQCIDEVNEDASDIICEEKKLKYNEEEDGNENEENISSSTNCFEAPAKSILKKWQISNFSRGSGSTFYIIDECGEIDLEEKPDVTENNASSSAPADEFEIACNSLNEELMKEGTFNIEELEKYYSKVQMENQIDNENFDEILQELSLNFGIDYKTPQSQVAVDKNVAAEQNEASISVKSEICETAGSSPEFENNKTTSTIKCDSGVNSCKENTIIKIDAVESDHKLIIKVKENVSEFTKADEIQQPNTSTSTTAPEKSSNSGKNMTIIYADGEDMAIDEEDVLLEEDTNTKSKPYEFYEYVSNDPKENEDNYNPEWQKLGRLTTDEERYKAVRDRWRSLVPPDPNRDLTCRQWRKKNQKPPLSFPSGNNNHQIHSSNERNQLCTAVFEMKIKRIIEELEQRRREILRKRHRDFNDLSQAQDREYSLMSMRGARDMDLAILGKQYIEDCRGLKNQYDLELEKISRITEEKIKILKDASEEVLLFQKFYKGFGAGDDKVCLYMTDIQVQELMETEDMLEQYTKYYK